MREVLSFLPGKRTPPPAADCRGRTLDFTRVRIMGVLNVTPDSFSDGGKFFDLSRALAEAMDRWPARRRLFVLGAVGDKDYRGMARVLAPAGHRFFVTLPPGGVPRPGLLPEKFRQALVRAGARHVEVHMDPWSALDAALSDAGEGDVVVVAGSLYLAGELRRRWVTESRILETGRAFPPELGL